MASETMSDSSAQTPDHELVAPPPPNIPFLTRLYYKVEDIYDEMNWQRVLLRMVSYSYVAFNLWLVYYLAQPSNWRTPTVHGDLVPIVRHDLNKSVFPGFLRIVSLQLLTLERYFNSFGGFIDCKIHAPDLYTPAESVYPGIPTPDVYCGTRKLLLEAMSSGGRIGFETPYLPRGTFYKIYGYVVEGTDMRLQTAIIAGSRSPRSA
jgi:hypothetical protein